MATRIINRDRRRSWRYYRGMSKLFLYLGVIAAVGAAPVLLFVLAGQWSALWLLVVLLVLCIAFFSCYAYVIGLIRK
jgi:hypothetical protein